MKQSQPLKTLVNLERQYDAIKKLIPEANIVIAEAVGMQRLFRQKFKFYAESWDLIKLPKPDAMQAGMLTEADTRLAMAHLLSMIEVITHARRLSSEARTAQNGLKVKLIELMLRLKKQVNYVSPQKPLPAFFMSKVSIPENSEQQKLKGKLGKWIPRHFGKKRKPKLDISAFDKKAIPMYIKKVLIEIYKDLDYFSTFQLTQPESIHKKIAALTKTEAYAQRKGNEFEAAAYNILLEMSLVQLELGKEVNQLFKSEKEKFDAFCREFLSVLD